MMINMAKYRSAIELFEHNSMFYKHSNVEIVASCVKVKKDIVTAKVKVRYYEDDYSETFNCLIYKKNDLDTIISKYLTN